MVKISIREQLAAAFLLTSLLSLMVLALSTWFQNKNFITNIRLSGLSLTASLKAAQLSSALLLYSAQVRSVSTRVLIQSALQRYNDGNNTVENWVRAQSDLESALAAGDVMAQAIIYPNSNTGNATAKEGLLNVTANDLTGLIQLPYADPDGHAVYLGDIGYGFPPSLYPNLTYGVTSENGSTSVSFDNQTLNPHGGLFLGPLILNQTSALFSVTTAIINNTSNQDILGWITVVVQSGLIYDIVSSLEGLGDSGEVLIVGPEPDDNLFPTDVRAPGQANSVVGQNVRFIFPPLSNSSVAARHSRRLPPHNSSTPFLISDYPAVEAAWMNNNSAINNAGSMISTHNEQNVRVSVGYAQLSTRMVDWVLLVEQSHDEVVAPINHLRDVVLICVFSVAGLLLLTIFPLAHYSIAPIRQLKAATSKTVEPYQPDDASGFTTTSHAQHLETEEDEEAEHDHAMARKEGFRGMMTMFNSKSVAPNRPTLTTRRRRTFRIPSKVPERHHWVTDELTDLTRTFNEMSDELTMQYERLEERVKERTAELEKSKQIAEAANQSKTLFIANISHELKTPLNGILGLTTVCMNEDDVSKIRSTLGTIYKSGDLLLHLLTDLLTFSKNEVGQQLSIDEAEFRLVDLSTQLMPTFDKQAREGQIDLKVLYLGSNDAFGNVAEDAGENNYGPLGTGRVRDMCLWGDKNRILQVLMNFVSNSLKFTPAHGSVTVRVRCLGLVENQPKGNQRQSSLSSRKSKSSIQKRVRTSEASLAIPSSLEEHKPRSSNNSVIIDDARLSINVVGGTTHVAKIVERRRSMSPPPLNTKDLMFEFEVEDTGPGIPEDQQKKIFEPFVQGDLGLSKKYGGTGLGLSICAQLAALMGGQISLDSQVGVGSKFSMRLPLRYTCERAASMASSRRTMSKAGSMVGGQFDDSDGTLQGSLPSEEGEVRRSEIPRIVGFTQPYVAKEVKPELQNDKLKVMKQAESEAAKAGRKVRVLVAEDNKINQEVVLRMLKLEDVYDVTIAKDGQEAFEKVRESMQTDQRFHLVFMDVQMPNVDGIQSTKLIRRMGFSAPIVALTAFAEKSNEDECMASGMDYFLAKPIRRPALKHVLKKYCATIIEEDGELSPGNTLSQVNTSERTPGDGMQTSTITSSTARGVANLVNGDDRPGSPNVSPLS